MHSVELQLCNSTLNTVKELTKISYIFMEPVQTSYFPDYLKIVGKPMDLSTLTTNLNGKRYGNFKDFFQDASLIHQNARLYHKNKSETQYILKLADSLEKILKKEEKRVKKAFLKYREEKRERKKERKAQAMAQSQAKISDKINLGTTNELDSSKTPEKESKKEKSKKPLLKLKLSSRNKSESVSGSSSSLANESIIGSKSKENSKYPCMYVAW